MKKILFYIMNFILIPVLVITDQVTKQLATDVVENLEVVTPGITTPVRRLSGGNVQKVLVRPPFLLRE